MFKVLVDIARSPHVVLDHEKSIELLDCIAEKHGLTRDLEEAQRYIVNFDEFYRYMRRKFEDYLTPSKNPRDSILGRVVVHKLKLYMKDGEKMVEILFDRRIDSELLRICLEQVVNDKVEFEKQGF